MKKTIFTYISVLLFVSFLMTPFTHAENTRATYPNSVSVEIYGKGLLWGLYFDKVLSDHIAVGIGLGRTGTQTSGGVVTETNASILPIYMNYYFSQNQGSIFLTGGANLVMNYDGVKDLKSTLGQYPFTQNMYPVLGFGYEHRSDLGFLFRITAYGFYTNSADDGPVKPWLGFHFGYSF